MNQIIHPRGKCRVSDIWSLVSLYLVRLKHRDISQIYFPKLFLDLENENNILLDHQMMHNIYILEQLVLSCHLVSVHL